VVEVRFSPWEATLMVKANFKGAVGDGLVGGEHLLAVFVEDGLVRSQNFVLNDSTSCPLLAP
jgi:hypothetical protein